MACGHVCQSQVISLADGQYGMSIYGPHCNCFFYKMPVPIKTGGKLGVAKIRWSWSLRHFCSCGFRGSVILLPFPYASVFYLLLPYLWESSRLVFFPNLNARLTTKMTKKQEAVESIDRPRIEEAHHVQRSEFVKNWITLHMTLYWNHRLFTDEIK